VWLRPQGRQVIPATLTHGNHPTNRHTRIPLLP
jgi:hypothetical protein